MNHDSRSTSSGAKVLRGLPPVALFLLAAASTAMISDLVIRGERQPQVATNVANPDTIGEKRRSTPRRTDRKCTECCPADTPVRAAWYCSYPERPELFHV